MKGSSTLTLNQDTVMQAVQDYLNKHIIPPVKITKFVPGQYEPYTYTTTIDEIVPETQPQEAVQT